MTAEIFDKSFLNLMDIPIIRSKDGCVALICIMRKISIFA